MCGINFKQVTPCQPNTMLYNRTMANIPTLKVDSTWVVIAGVVLLLIFFLGTPSFRIWSPSFNLHHRLYYGGGHAPYYGWEGFSNSGGAATFTMFGTEWCGACKQARPEFDKLGPTVTSGGKTVTIRFVNHETERELAKGYEILGYPTFYLDMDGKRTKYEGPRTEQGFRQFLQ